MNFIANNPYPEAKCELVQTPQEVEKFFTNKREIYQPVDGETLFIIARHGENESNVKRTYDGRTLNLPLTLKGHEQGKIAGEKIRTQVDHIDHVILTSMCRTDQTAREILKAFSASQPEMPQDDRFLERHVGKFEGGPLKALEPTNSQDKQMSASKTHSFKEKMDFSPGEGIESYASIWKRAYAGLQAISLDFKGKVVLVVTHSGTMRSIYWHLTQKLGFFVPYENFKPDNGAYMIVSAKDGNMTLLDTHDIHITHD